MNKKDALDIVVKTLYEKKGQAFKMTPEFREAKEKFLLSEIVEIQKILDILEAYSKVNNEKI